MAAHLFEKGTAVKMDLHILITEEADVYNATCLEMGLATAGPDLQTVRRDMMELIAAHLSACRAEGRPQDVLVPAPPEYWRAYFEAVQKGECRPQRSVPESELRPTAAGLMSHLSVRSFVCATR